MGSATSARNLRPVLEARHLDPAGAKRTREPRALRWGRARQQWRAGGPRPNRARPQTAHSTNRSHRGGPGCHRPHRHGSQARHAGRAMDRNRPLGPVATATGWRGPFIAASAAGVNPSAQPQVHHACVGQVGVGRGRDVQAICGPWVRPPQLRIAEGPIQAVVELGTSALPGHAPCHVGSPRASRL